MWPTRRQNLALGALLALVTASLAALLRETPPRSRPQPATVPVVRQLALPKNPGAIRFAVLGDTGRGDALQYETAEELTRWHDRFGFEFVLLLGDNIYGPGTPDDLDRRFSRPYAALLAREVSFFAVRGNHDPDAILTYAPLGMQGRRYYAFEKRAGIPPLGAHALFIALDTVSLDGPQIEWLDRTLTEATAGWRIAFYHHPLYTSGQYRLRARHTRWWLESHFVAGGVDVGFSGHEHFYERLQPQRGVQYFTSGAGGALRRGDIRPSPVLAAGFDDDTHFILIELASDELHFQAVSRTGRTVDAGSVPRDPGRRAPPRLRR
jgi:hypothetical protein